MLILRVVDEIIPPHRPAWLATSFPFSTGIPSFHQVSLAGGLLELESQNSVASVPTVRDFGSTLIFNVSGKTKKNHFIVHI